MKKKVFFAAILVVCGVVGYVSYAQYQSGQQDDLLMANVEALTRFETESKIGYSSMHLPCYDVVMVNGKLTTIENGKYSATCWENPNSSNSNCHSHSCSSCSSE